MTVENLFLLAPIDRVNGNATTLGGMKVVEYHAAFFYLLRDLNLTRLGAIEKIENQEPPALHIANITKIIKTNIEAGNNLIIIQSLNLPNEIVWQVARDTGTKISYLVALMGNYQNVNFTSYIQMIDYDLVAIQNPTSPPSSIVPGFNSFSLLFPLTIISFLEIFKKKVR